MNEPLYIYGAKYAHNPIAIAESHGYTTIFLIDDNVELHGKVIAGRHVVGNVFNAPVGSNVVCCIGNTRNRLKVVKKAKQHNLKFVNIIHKSATVDTEDIGVGNIICQNAVIQYGSSIGDHCYIHAQDVIGPYCKIGNYVNINSSVCISSSTVIDDYAYLGVSSTTLQWSRVGIGATLGAAALLPMRKTLDPLSTGVGVPFRYLRQRVILSTENKPMERYEHRPTTTEDIKEFGKFGEVYFEHRMGYGGYVYNREVTADIAKHVMFNIDSTCTSLLDIGSSKGLLLKYLNEKHPHMTLRGIDLSEYAVENRVFENIDHGSASDLPYKDNSFDGAVSLMCLYILPKKLRRKAISELVRVCKKSAYIRIKIWQTEEERELLLKWEPNIEDPFSLDQWLHILVEENYQGIVEFVTMGVE